MAKSIRVIDIAVHRAGRQMVPMNDFPGFFGPWDHHGHPVDFDVDDDNDGEAGNDLDWSPDGG